MSSDTLRRPGLKKDRSFLQVSAFLTFLPLQFWHHGGHRHRVAGAAELAKSLTVLCPGRNCDEGVRPLGGR